MNDEQQSGEAQPKDEPSSGILDLRALQPDPNPTPPGQTPARDASGGPAPSPVSNNVSRYALTFFVPEIWQPVDLTVVSQLQAAIRTEPEQTEIHWWLYSGGGSADATYKMAWASSKLAKRVVIVIPYMAKSAATLLAMAGHEVYMDLNSELGPLDAQIVHPDRELRISVLDILGSLPFMTSKANEMIREGLGNYIIQSPLGTEDKIAQLREYSEGLLDPFLSKIDPILLTRAYSALRIAGEYGQRILKQRNVPEEQQAKMLQRLVGNYPSHGFVINYEEAASLGFPVKPLSQYPFREQILSSFGRYMEASLASPETRNLISITDLDAPTNPLMGGLR